MTTVKKILLFQGICVLLFSACQLFTKNKTTNMDIKGDYTTAWLEVDSLEKQGLPKSALTKTEEIAARAHAENNTDQILKSTVFRGKYITELEEDGIVKAIQLFENETKTAGQPGKSILQSMLGELYATYLSNNGWNLNNRTPISDGEGGDILTWSAAQIEKRATDCYNASVEPIALLGTTPITTLKEIIIAGSLDSLDGLALRPTLLDLLGHRAAAHFANDRSYLTEPTYKFILDQEAAFAPPAAFSTATFNTKDTTSGKWLAMQTYQRLTRFHLATDDHNPALLDLTVSRLQFARNASARPDVLELYMKALDNLHQQYSGTEGDADVQYQRAQVLFQNDHDPNFKVKNAIKTAADICEDAIRQHPGALGAKQCAALLSQIKKKTANVSLEQVQLPNRPILMSIPFKNVSKLWYKIIKVTEKESAANQYLSYEQFKQMADLPVLVSKEIAITDPGDLKDHRTEINVDGLPVGKYIIAIYKNADLSFGQVYDFTEFKVSNLGIVDITQSNDGKSFLVADRASGQPLSGISGEVIEKRWDGGQYVIEVTGKTITDKDGIARVTARSNTAVFVRFRNGDDIQDSNDFYTNDRNQEGQSYTTIEFFTDRGLYRPGQTMYFKGIALNKQANKKPVIVANTPVSVILRDANGQEKQTLSLKTNEFGTFNGTFSLPIGGLTGSFSLFATLSSGQGETYFNVEEYKRPKFEVTFKPVAGSYKINEKVTVTGEAMNYAGNPTDGATVSYRVTRYAFFPYRWTKFMPPIPYGQAQEITFGETQTGIDGTFNISFTALPDDQVYPKGSEPIFRYDISADVTDAAGETRYGAAEVVAGAKSIILDNNLAEETNPDSLKNTLLITQNLSQQKVAVSGIISLQQLGAPTAIFKDRVFPVPDVQTISEATFRELFPEFAYNGENDAKNWKPVGAPLVYNFDSGKSDRIDLTTQKIAPGYYKVTMTAKDDKGNDAVSEKIIRIKKTATDLLLPGGIVGKSVLEPGEKAQVILASSFPTIYAYVLEHHQNDRVKQGWETIQGSKNFATVVEEKDRGGFYTYWVIIYDNRVYNGAAYWEVPYTNQKLNISFETFRDKLAPGQKEEWRLRISGPGKEKVAAELVAAMYDASLDQFMPFGWNFAPFENFYAGFEPLASNFGMQVGGNYIPDSENVTVTPLRTYPTLNWFDFPMYGGGRMYMTMAMDAAAPAGAMKRNGNVEFVPPIVSKDEEAVNEEFDYGEGHNQPPPPPPAPGTYPSSIRTNLNETVFFFPELRTDYNGDVLVKFTMNEALTRWKLQVLAHTKDLKYALAEKLVVTQKDLMITANAPRFLRTGDEITFSAKVSNLTDLPAAGKASLALLDAATLQPVEKLFGLTQPVADFNIPAKQSAPVFWTIKIPKDYTGALTWQVFADSKAGRDGEESTIPVITNRMLVTETISMALRGNQEKTFRFDAWKDSPTRTPVRNSLEFSSNPVWYAVQSLPYLMEYPHECSEQIFSRFYANTLSRSVTEKMPAIRRVYDRWKGTPAMLSNLSKNQELKSALLEETPWVMDAQDEEKQKQQIALLFNLNRMTDERTRALTTLAERQSSNGGWSWFQGGRESWSITQHIVCGMLHLERLEAFSPQSDPDALNMLDRAMGFCQASAQKEYDDLEKRVKEGKAKWDDDHLNSLIIQYLYARSFYPLDKPDKIFSFYVNLVGKYWKSKNLYEQGMLALITHRTGQKEVGQQIVRSLKERALVKEELGMYWPNEWGMYWYQLPIETQAMMVEVFNEVANDRTAVDNLRIWLLKNKQTNRWESTKATSEAVYALLLTGDSWLEDTQPVKISIDGKKVSVKEYEPGTGYFKQQVEGAAITKPWNAIEVQNPNKTIVWGAAYRQYFDDIDQITTFKKTGLTIDRQVFIQKNTDKGPELTVVNEGDVVHVGDQLKVRIEIRSDRPMEFVHLKDMRPSGCEPKNVLSRYHYQSGLGYYESTRDLATHFFIDYLPRGTYVLEYPLAATHKGNMSFGISTLQCMYAPEFSSHSAGIRIKIE